jgi:hypothetical protein
MSPTAAAKSVKIRKSRGDDAYSWAMFVNGVRVLNGMDRREAPWRRRVAIKNLVADRRWSECRWSE